MDDFEPSSPLECNPITHRRYRREVFWQVTVPIIIGFILVAALAYLAYRTSSDQASVWADISTIWMIIPVMMITLLSLVFLAASIYLIMQLIHILPFYSHRVQEWFSLLAIQIRRLDKIAVEPVLRIQGLKASISTLGRNVRRK